MKKTSNIFVNNEVFNNKRKSHSSDLDNNINFENKKYNEFNNENLYESNADLDLIFEKNKNIIKN